jgi:energy-coupling factor transporter ATP-binding protein EcfA2
MLLDGVDIRSSKQERGARDFASGWSFNFLVQGHCLRNMGLGHDETDARVREAARFVDLPEDLLEKSPFALSGGYRRWLIAMRPRGRDSLLENINAYHFEPGAAVIIVTHSMEEAARGAHRGV